MVIVPQSISINELTNQIEESFSEYIPFIHAKSINRIMMKT